MLAIPPLLTVGLWRHSGRALRAYMLTSLVLLLAMVPVMSRMIDVGQDEFRGLAQRIFTLTIFVPIEIACGVLASRLKALHR